MNESRSSIGLSGTESRQAIESHAKEISDAREATVSPIVATGQPNGVFNCRFNFEVPFESKEKVVLYNQSAPLYTSEIMDSDRKAKVSRFMELNFPVVGEIYVDFEIGASWAGYQFSSVLQRDVRSCAEAVLIMRDRSFIVDVHYPVSGSMSDHQDALRSGAKGRILEIFREEAKKIDPNYVLRMNGAVTSGQTYKLKVVSFAI